MNPALTSFLAGFDEETVLWPGLDPPRSRAVLNCAMLRTATRMTMELEAVTVGGLRALAQFTSDRRVSSAQIGAQLAPRLARIGSG